MYPLVKRTLDFILALLGIIATSPLWLIAIVGILLSDGTPIFYRAERIGRANRKFEMLKFRSMTVLRTANEAGLRAEEARIFPFGRFIRRFKIDELPQLLNILKGDMSVIGPRPVAVDQFSLFRTGRWNEAARVNVGLSGPAALYDYIYGDSITDEAEYIEKVYPTRRELEYAYVSRMSFLYDTKMVLYTVVAIIGSALGLKCRRILRELEETARQSAESR